MKGKKLVSLFLIATMALSLVACGNKEVTTTEEGAKEPATAASSDTPLVIASGAFSEKFSPFFAESVYDQNIVGLTQITLITNDRAGQYILDGMDGYTAEYNGTEYSYLAPANLEITENADGTVFYDFTLRDDLTFSDGVAVTADDIIFSMYVYADPTYDGSTSLYSLPIEGMDEYRSGVSTLSSLIAAAGSDNSDFTYWTEDQQKAFWAAASEGGAAFAQEIVDYCVEAGYGDDVTSAASAWGFDLADGATAEDFYMAIGESYGWSFSAMEAESAGSALADLIPADVYGFATTGITTGDSADHISGIVKTGDKSVRIVLTEVDATAVGNLGVYVAPMHYYGDESLYDYDNNKFGFTKNDLSSVRAKTTTPLGAGPYKFVNFENKTVYLEANDTFYKQAPVTKNVQFKESTDADMIPGVVQGTVDIAEPSISKAALEQIAGENPNGELSGEVLTTSLVDNRGYGYIGMCSKNVKVGDDASSEASKNLRKAIATVLAVYRDVVIDSYYGDAADVINYPISNTSWAAPQKSDADYAVAFSKDVDGNPIYTDGMSEDEKYEAALKAALGFFEAAGYTVADGKVTAAPAGAEMSYEIMIPADGQGDHPAFGILTAAKDAMAQIGFELVINDLSDSSVLWDALRAQTADIWCAAWQTTIDPDMYQIYHSEGGSAYQYAIYSDELDSLIVEGRTNTNQAYRKAIYKECLDFIVDYAVEIPTYQRQNGSIASSERINVETLAQDQTTYYSYLDELYTIQMN